MVDRSQTVEWAVRGTVGACLRAVGLVPMVAGRDRAGWRGRAAHIFHIVWKTG